MTVLYDSPGGVHTLSRLAGGRKALVPSRVTLGQSYRLEVHGAPGGATSPDSYAGLGARVDKCKYVLESSK